MIILGNSRRSLPWKTYSSNKPYNNPLNFVMDSALMHGKLGQDLEGVFEKERKPEIPEGIGEVQA